MDRELYTDSFEQLLKEQADKFTMKPTQRVWHGIYNDLHPGRRWPSIAIGLLLVASILLLGYFNTNGRKVANYTAALAAQDKGGPTAQTEAMPAALATAHANGLLAEPLAADPMRLMAPTAPTAPAASPVALLPGHALLLVAPVVTNRLLPRRTSRRSAVMALQNHGRQSITVQSAEMGTQHHDVPLDRNPTGQRKATDNINEGYNEGLPPNGSPTARSQADQQVLYVASEQIPADADNFQPGNAPANELSQTVKSPSVPVAAADATASPATTATPLTKAEKKQAAKAQGYRVLSEADKAWIDHDVLYNQRPGRKWKNKLGWQAYLAPSVTYRTLFENSAAEGSTNVQSLLINPFVRQAGLENTVDHRVGLGMELGGALVLQASPKWQFRLGAQFNYNSYQVMANKVGHPVNTAITLNNLHTGELQLQSRSANTSNTQGANQNPIKNYTVQLSLPVGFAYKLAGKNALKLYAGASLQPSFVLAGSSPLLSSDRLFYVENGTRNRNTSLMRNFNLALGFETFASYRLGEYTLSAGPQLRYQLLTTNSNRYTIGEKVYNVGLRIGVSKLF